MKIIHESPESHHWVTMSHIIHESYDSSSDFWYSFQALDWLMHITSILKQSLNYAHRRIEDVVKPSIESW